MPVKLTRKRLKELLDYDPLTGIFKWKVSIKSTKAGDVAGGYESKGYRRIKIDGRIYKAHRLAWFYVYGKWPKGQIDHEDHIKDHNWIKNLKDITHLKNQRNRPMHSDNTSGFTGVYWDENRGKWKASIRVQDKLKHLGYFIDKNKAIKARKAANVKYDYHKNHGV